MLNQSLQSMMADAKDRGWVLEPQAKQIMKDQGLEIPAFVLTRDPAEASAFLAQTDNAVVAKAVSGRILHKTEFDAVVTHIRDSATLEREMERLLALPGCEQVLIEEMVQGIEVMIGSKNDVQFGPVVLLGLGGTAVEIYNDTAIRLAPVTPGDVLSMVDSLTAAPLFKGHRGQAGVNLDALQECVVAFSNLVMELEPWYESIDLNPVICGPDTCVVADARIMLFK